MRYLIVLVGLLAMGSANAITYDFSGIIDKGELVLKPNNVTGIVVGSTFSGSLEFDPGTYSLAIPGIFLGGITDYELSVGGNTYRKGRQPIEFQVTDQGLQRFTDNVPQVNKPGLFPDEVFFFFTGLPGIPPTSLDTFDSARFLLVTAVGAGRGEGPITSFTRRAEVAVPEPSTLALLGMCLVGLAVVRRSGNRSLGS